MKCLVCGKESPTDLCGHHAEARENLKAAYPLWVEAYGGLEWMEYLDKVKRNVQSGQWVKDVAEFLQGG
jgi:hypothetical protein